MEMDHNAPLAPQRGRHPRKSPENDWATLIARTHAAKITQLAPQRDQTATSTSRLIRSKMHRTSVPLALEAASQRPVAEFPARRRPQHAHGFDIISNQAAVEALAMERSQAAEASRRGCGGVRITHGGRGRAAQSMPPWTRLDLLPSLGVRQTAALIAAGKLAQADDAAGATTAAVIRRDYNVVSCRAADPDKERLAALHARDHTLQRWAAAQAQRFDPVKQRFELEETDAARTQAERRAQEARAARYRSTWSTAALRSFARPYDIVQHTPSTIGPSLMGSVTPSDQPQGVTIGRIIAREASPRRLRGGPARLDAERAQVAAGDAEHDRQAQRRASIARVRHEFEEFAGYNIITNQ